MARYADTPTLIMAPTLPDPPPGASSAMVTRIAWRCEGRDSLTAHLDLVSDAERTAL